MLGMGLAAAGMAYARWQSSAFPAVPPCGIASCPRLYALRGSSTARVWHDRPAGEAFSGRCVIEIVWVEFAAQLSETPFEILSIDTEVTRQAKEAEVITKPPERKDAVALRAEVLIDRRAGAAIATLERRD